MKQIHSEAPLHGAVIDPANPPSRKRLANNGFVSGESEDFDGLPGEVLERVW